MKKYLFNGLLFFLLSMLLVGCATKKNTIVGSWNVCGFTYRGEDISIKESKDLTLYPTKLSMFYAEMKLTFFQNGKLIMQRPAFENEDTKEKVNLDATYEEEDGIILIDLDGERIIMEKEDNMILWDSSGTIVKFKK